jgi:hypothetical protein
MCRLCRVRVTFGRRAAHPSCARGEWVKVHREGPLLTSERRLFECGHDDRI